VTDSLARAVLVPFILLVFLLSATSVAPATAHYKDAKLDIYIAITLPVIDGVYNMTLNKAHIAAQEKVVDEWNDAAWIEIPKRVGNLTAYSGYKYDEKFLYMAHDFISVTESSFNKRGSAGTAFDPLHDDGAVAARPDDFIILPYWDETFQVYVRYGQKNGKYGQFKPAPKGLIANSNMTTSPFSSTSHLFYEVKVPLTVGDLYKHIDSTVGIFQEAYNVDASGEKSDNWYPMAGDYWRVDNYADATFSKAFNPRVTVPPTVVPEFPAGFAPTVAVAVFMACVIMLGNGRTGRSRGRNGSTRRA